jgi:RNA polymerase sigma factor (sigma-70 family)
MFDAPDPQDITGSITRRFKDYEAGNVSAFDRLFEIYFPKVFRVAGSKLSGSGARTDAEDIASTVMAKLALNIADGRYKDRLKDRDELWLLMKTITYGLCCDYYRRKFSTRRGGGTTFNSSDFMVVDDEGNYREILAFVEASSDHEVAAALRDSIEYLVEKQIVTPLTRAVAQLKISGHTDEEISKHLDISKRSVTRKLGEIRRLWEKSEAST